MVKIREKGKIELERLNKDIKNLENHNQTLNDNEEIKYFKNTKEYTPPELMEDVLKYITELAGLLGFDTNDESFKDKSPTNYVSICRLILEKMNETENFINDRIDTFEKLMESDDLEERNLIEKIINERKKEIKKEKFNKLLKMQKEEVKKTNMKMIEKANKFVFKWRKIGVEYPFKKKKIKKKVVEENHDDDILYYSSEEN